jgi:hypothetical protein
MDVPLLHEKMQKKTDTEKRKRKGYFLLIPELS